MKLLGLFTNTSSFTKSLVISAETGSHRLDRFSVSTTLLSRAYTGLLVLLGGDHEGGGTRMQLPHKEGPQPSRTGLGYSEARWEKVMWFQPKTPRKGDKLVRIQK